MSQPRTSSESLRAWRSELRAWLEEHVPRDLPALDSHEDSAGYRAWEHTAR